MADPIQKIEKVYVENKNHLEDIANNVVGPDPAPVPKKKSIYEDFAKRITSGDVDFVVELEKEIHRNIKEFPPNVATKRIMELIWLTRYEW